MTTRERQMTRQGQSGGALITVLFLVVVLSFLVLSITQTTTQAAQRSFFSRNHSEVYWRAIGVEALAVSALRSALDASEGVVAADNPLFTTVFNLPLEGASASLAFSDRTRCLNVNALAAAADENGDGGDTTAAAISRRELTSYARSIGESPADIDQLADVVGDWIDADSVQEPRGAEDNFYTALPTPYRTGNRPLADISELRAMANVDAEFYRRVSPFLCAHPSNEFTPININMLTPEDAPLLSAVLQDSVSAASARDIIAETPPGGYQSLEQFAQAPAVQALPNIKLPRADATGGDNDDDEDASDDDGGAVLGRGVIRQPGGGQTGGGRFGGDGDDDEDESPVPAGRLAVTSQYLAARGLIEQGGLALEMNILFRINEGQVEVVSRRIGRRI